MATKDDVIGKRALGSEGEEVGLVSTVFEDRETGELEWLVVREGLLGRSRRLVPVAGADVRETGVFLPYPSDKLEAAPEFDGEEISEEEERRLYAHYGLEYSERRSVSGLPEGEPGDADETIGERS